MNTRIILFGTHPNQFNGYSKVVYEICKLEPKNMEIIIYGFQNFHKEKARPELKNEIYDAVKHEDPKESGFGIKQAMKFVEDKQPDIVIVFNDVGILTAILTELSNAKNRKEFKVIAYLDQVYSYTKQVYINMLNENTDYVIAFTEDWKDCIHWQGLEKQCFVLPHGINTENYYPIPKKLARLYFGFNQEDFLILNLNRNQPRKRWDICIQAFAEVVKQKPDEPIKLVIATALNGAWNLIQLLQREFKKRDIDINPIDRIIVPGNPQRLSDKEINILLSAADIGINTCDGEGFGLCNFEHAAVGRPQIVPNIGGFKHFFEKEESAIMIDPVLSLYSDTPIGGEMMITKYQDYTNAILKMYENTQLRETMGKNARKNIIQNHQWKHVVQKFENIILEIMDKNKKEINSKEININELEDNNKDQLVMQIAKLKQQLKDLELQISS